MYLRISSFFSILKHLCIESPQQRPQHRGLKFFRCHACHTEIQLDALQMKDRASIVYDRISISKAFKDKQRRGSSVVVRDCNSFICSINILRIERAKNRKPLEKKHTYIKAIILDGKRFISLLLTMCVSETDCVFFY